MLLVYCCCNNHAEGRSYPDWRNLFTLMTAEIILTLHYNYDSNHNIVINYKIPVGDDLIRGRPPVAALVQPVGEPDAA
jgi:hypothetical protein